MKAILRGKRLLVGTISSVTIEQKKKKKKKRAKINKPKKNVIFGIIQMRMYCSEWNRCIAERQLTINS